MCIRPHTQGGAVWTVRRLCVAEGECPGHWGSQEMRQRGGKGSARCLQVFGGPEGKRTQQKGQRRGPAMLGGAPKAMEASGSRYSRSHGR